MGDITEETHRELRQGIALGVFWGASGLEGSLVLLALVHRLWLSDAALSLVEALVLAHVGGLVGLCIAGGILTLRRPQRWAWLRNVLRLPLWGALSGGVLLILIAYWLRLPEIWHTHNEFQSLFLLSIWTLLVYLQNNILLPERLKKYFNRLVETMHSFTGSDLRLLFNGAVLGISLSCSICAILVLFTSTSPSLWKAVGGLGLSVCYLWLFFSPLNSRSDKPATSDTPLSTTWRGAGGEASTGENGSSKAYRLYPLFILFSATLTALLGVGLVIVLGGSADLYLWMVLFSAGMGLAALIEFLTPCFFSAVRLDWQRLSRFLPEVVFGVMTIALVYLFLNALLNYQVITGAETYTISNVPIEFALHNKFHYPLWNQDYSCPGIGDLFLAHPPLCYYLRGWYLKGVGIGVWQIVSPLYAATLLLALLTVFTARKIYGAVSATGVSFLFIAFWPNIDTLLRNARCDVFTGVNLSFYLLALAGAWRNRGVKSLVLSALAGALAIAVMASHWVGVFVFLVAPLYLFVMAWQRRVWWKHTIAFGLGVFVALLIWEGFYRFYGNMGFIDAIRIIFDVSQGIKQRPSLQSWSPWAVYTPLWTTLSGKVILGGILLSALHAIWKIAVVAKRWWRTPSKGRITKLNIALCSTRCLWESLLWGSLITFIIFFYFNVANRSSQYLPIIYFPGFLLATRGYAHAWQGLQVAAQNARLHLPRITLALVSGLVIFSLISPDFNFIKQGLLPPVSVWRLPQQPPNMEYTRMRHTLQRFVSPEYHLIIGAQINHFLYEYPYTALDFLETQGAVQYDPSPPALLEARWGIDIGLAGRQALTKEAGQIMLVPDVFGLFQRKFFDQRIWEPNFKKIAVVYQKDTGLFPILYRNDIAATQFARLGIAPNSAGCEGDVVYLVYNPLQDRPLGITNKEWVELGALKREQMLRAYFEDHAWFGLPQLRQPGWTMALVKSIDAYFAQHEAMLQALAKGYGASEDERRSLEQAIDAWLLPQVPQIICIPSKNPYQVQTSN